MKNIRKILLIMTCCLIHSTPAAAGNVESIQAAVIKQADIVTDSSGTLAEAAAETPDIHDSLFAEAKSYSRNYGVAYGVYTLQPILHIAV